MELKPRYRVVTAVAPWGVTTGGVELLHQLVHEINTRGGDARICYFPFGNDKSVPTEYLNYRCETVPEPVDEPGCAIVFPEVYPHLVTKIRYSQTIFWWMSVENALGGPEARYRRKARLILRLARLVALHPDTLHLYQSEYARRFIRTIGIRGGTPLFDYISEGHIMVTPTSNRARTIAYNPKKGFAETTMLKKALPDIDFVALEGFSRSEVANVLKGSLVYIDFGHHPGKDRIPREAAIAGAVILLARRGSVCNWHDVPLLDRYKIEINKDWVTRAVLIIRDMISNYATHFAAQEYYRRQISYQKMEFEEQLVGQFFQEKYG